MNKILVLAFLVEALVETLKPIWDTKKFDWNKLIALFIGVLITFSTSANLFKLLEIELKHPIIGEILTGILISRGATIVFDLISRIKNLMQSRINLNDSESERESI